MDIRKLQRAIIDGLEDVKAQDIKIFNTEHLSPLFERVIIASGTSNRQTRALASSVRETVKSRGMLVMRTEGEDNGEWIIVDCGAAVAHIMQPTIRDYYHLEEIWGGKPVKMKMDGERGLPKAADGEDVDADVPTRAPRKTPAAKKTTTAAKKAAAPKKTAAAKAPAAKKAAPAKKAITRTVGVKSSSASAAAKKPAAKKAPARKTARRTGA